MAVIKHAMNCPDHSLINYLIRKGCLLETTQRIQEDKRTLDFLIDFITKWEECIDNGLADESVDIMEKKRLYEIMQQFVDCKGNYLHIYLEEAKLKLPASPDAKYSESFDKINQVVNSLKETVELILQRKQFLEEGETTDE